MDPDGRIYIRGWQGGILSGGFEKNPKPIFTEGRNQLEIQNLQEDWDHFGMWARTSWRGKKNVWNFLALPSYKRDLYNIIYLFDF